MYNACMLRQPASGPEALSLRFTQYCQYENTIVSFQNLHLQLC